MPSPARNMGNTEGARRTEGRRAAEESMGRGRLLGTNTRPLYTGLLKHSTAVYYCASQRTAARTLRAPSYSAGTSQGGAALPHTRALLHCLQLAGLLILQCPARHCHVDGGGTPDSAAAQIPPGALRAPLKAAATTSKSHGILNGARILSPKQLTVQWRRLGRRPCPSLP